MKAQNTNKIVKKTVFVYKSVKDQNNFVTNPISDQSQTVVTNGTFIVNF
ncbi:hypothetical protein [Pedobacter paludis]|nr:hypothetical protein [Pedobacter paludis]